MSVLSLNMDLFTAGTPAFRDCVGLGLWPYKHDGTVDTSVGWSTFVRSLPECSDLKTPDAILRLAPFEGTGRWHPLDGVREEQLCCRRFD
jgi:hypothetical protein